MISAAKRALRFLLLLAAVAALLATASCSGDVYMGVGVAGPWVGYPYGGYPYGMPMGGGVYVGRPF